MGKQKFCCKGVLRTTGQRVSVMVSADNREAAIEIAKKHDVAVESVMPVAEAAPTPPKVVDKKLEARIDDILSADDDDLPGGMDDLDLGDNSDAAATAPSLTATKACPYCGEQILAVAVKCKHCGSYVGAKAVVSPQPSANAPSRGVPMRVWVIVGVIVAAVIIAVPVVIILGWFMWKSRPAAPIELPSAPEPAVAAPPSAPTPPQIAPKPTAYKPSSEEMAFTSKLTAFLGSCDELAKLLEKGPKLEQYNKQCGVVKSRHAAIPPPPQSSSWAGEAAAASTQFVGMKLDVLTLEVTTLDAAMEALHQSAGDSPETREAYRNAAVEVRKSVNAIRGLIPPACLAKPK